MNDRLFSLDGYDTGSLSSGEVAVPPCAPGITGSLPDGVWAGLVASQTEDTLVFDLVCLEAAYDPSDDMDYLWITNNNPLLRTATIAPDVVVVNDYLAATANPT